MTTPPQKPLIYHITHVDNLPSIVADGCLWSDAVMTDRGGPAGAIGMTTIKQRRLERPVTCHPTTRVGDCVPFYFCARSVMLYLLHRGNHEDLTYRGGQEPIVHIEADLEAAIRWAESLRRPWAFSLQNAASNYAQFRRDRANLQEVNWEAVRATDWRPPLVKEGKQAEFLLYEGFP